MKQNLWFHLIKVELLKPMIYGLLVLFIVGSCNKDDSTDESDNSYPVVDRLSKLPADIAKRSPQTDQYPPVLHSTEYEDPVPLSSEINTSGGEDSPFILPDGDTLYFFFTPDRKSVV